MGLGVGAGVPLGAGVGIGVAVGAGTGIAVGVDEATNPSGVGFDDTVGVGVGCAKTSPAPTQKWSAIPSDELSKSEKEPPTSSTKEISSLPVPPLTVSS